METYILFLEYAPGGSLEDLIRDSGGALPESDIRLYTRMIVKGLCHIHENGYVHCDIKPSNILVFSTEGGGNEVKIADFGLSKRVEEERALQLPQFNGTPRVGCVRRRQAAIGCVVGGDNGGGDGDWETGMEEVGEGGFAV